MASGTIKKPKLGSGINATTAKKTVKTTSKAKTTPETTSKPTTATTTTTVKTTTTAATTKILKSIFNPKGFQAQFNSTNSQILSQLKLVSKSVNSTM